MILRQFHCESLAAEFQIDLAASFLVGDKAIDIECGRRAGTRTVLVRTGYGAALERDPDFKAPDFVANDAPEAVRWILERSSGNRVGQDGILRGD